MVTLEKILKADQAGPKFRKLYDQSHYALAGLVPIAALGGEHTPLTRLTDFALAAVIPVHMHVGANGIVSDYVPPRFMGASRWGLLAASGITFLGLMKLNVSGPGITSTVKSLWHKPEKQ